MKSAARSVSGSVTGRRLRMRRPPGRSYWIDTPRSPRTAPASQSTYCTASGRFSPSASRSRAAASGLPSVPMIRAAGSPGSTRMTTKTSSETNTRVAMNAATLRRMYRRTPASARSGSLPVLKRPEASHSPGYDNAPHQHAGGIRDLLTASLHALAVAAWKRRAAHDISSRVIWLQDHLEVVQRHLHSVAPPIVTPGLGPRHTCPYPAHVSLRRHLEQERRMR